MATVSTRVADAQRLIALLGGRPRDRRTVSGDASDPRATIRQWRAEPVRQLPHRTRDSRPDVGLSRGPPQVLLEFIHLLPNGFSTPTTTTLAFIKAGYNVDFQPTDARLRLGASKIRLARRREVLRDRLKIVTLFSPLRVFLPIAISSFLLGVAYGIWNVVAHQRIPNGSVLLILFSVVVFLVGLVSEQISALRFETGSRSRG